VKLKPGESKTITFTLNAKTLQFYTARKKWEVEPGEFNVWVGGDSNASLMKSFSVIE
jgi:beta-glucosidase